MACFGKMENRGCWPLHKAIEAMLDRNAGGIV